MQLFSMPLSFHTSSNTGALTRSMERGMRAVTAVLSRIVLHLFPQSVELAMVATIIGVRAGFDLAFVAVGTVGLYAAFTIAAVNTRTKYLEQMNLADNQATSRLLDGLLHYEVVSAYNRQSFEASRYEASVAQYQKAQIKSQMALAGLNLGQKVVEALGTGYLLWKTSFMVLAGTMSVGELIMINSLLLQLMGPLDHLGANYMQLNQGLVDAREMFTILKSTPPKSADLPDQQQQKMVLQPGRPIEIAFKNVHFAYTPTPVDSVAKEGRGENGGHTHTPSHGVDSHSDHVLRGFDLTIERGTTVAIVGESGCGKSTVTRLVTRAVTASQGHVLLDGQDVAELDGDSVRECVALVQQDASLFNEDLAYNIKYGRPEASEDEILAASLCAQLESVTNDLEHGLATQVGDRGTRLSGGQRQRVALARALVKDAPILLCDEATSALDVYTEGRVMDSLRQVRKGKTTIIIAHRLSTIVQADEIVVMAQGRVVERGSHALLMSQKGSRYAAMWAAQERQVLELGLSRFPPPLPALLPPFSFSLWLSLSLFPFP